MRSGRAGAAGRAEVWADDGLADRLERRAAALRASFSRDFWMPERGCHALALDGDKRQVDGLTSNIGHLLWSGILDDAESGRKPPSDCSTNKLYSGWGRANPRLSRGPVYNPTRLTTPAPSGLTTTR